MPSSYIPLNKLFDRCRDTERHHLGPRALHCTASTFGITKAARPAARLLAPFAGQRMSKSSVYHSSGVRLLGGDEAFALDQELFNDYQYTLDQLMELAGQAVAHSVVDTYHDEPLSMEKHWKVRQV